MSTLTHSTLNSLFVSCQRIPNSSWKFKFKWVIVAPNLGIPFGKILIEDVKLYKKEKYGKMFPSRRRYKSQ